MAPNVGQRQVNAVLINRTLAVETFAVELESVRVVGRIQLQQLLKFSRLAAVNSSSPDGLKITFLRSECTSTDRKMA